MKIPNTISLLVVTVFLNSIHLFAKETDKEKSPQPPNWFSKLDRNGNGLLNSKEAGRFLGAMGINNDGKITISEAVAYTKKRRSLARKGKRQSRWQIVFKAEALKSIKKTGDGLWVVSIGHSCVIPAINPCITISRSAGYENHTHLMQFFGGGGGAPEAQWGYIDAKQQAKPALATRKIDVMTFGHLVDFRGKSVGCNVEDYERWIDFALKHNKKIKFYIQDLWPWLPGTERTVNIEKFNLKDYEAAMAISGKSLDSVVEKLNQKYPGRVNVLPAGQAMTELVRRVTRNDLPGVDAILISSNENKKGMRVGLYRDKIHPTKVIASLQGYIYFACLYGKNPVQLKTGIYPDQKLDQILREVAWKIVSQHPFSGVKD